MLASALSQVESRLASMQGFRLLVNRCQGVIAEVACPTFEQRVLDTLRVIASSKEDESFTLICEVIKD